MAKTQRLKIYIHCRDRSEMQFLNKYRKSPKKLLNSRHGVIVRQGLHPQYVN